MTYATPWGLHQDWKAHVPCEAEMQEALRDLRGSYSIVDQVGSFCPEVQTVIRDFLQIKHLPAPPDTVEHRAKIDRISRRRLNELLLDSSRVRDAADPLQRLH